MNNIKQDLVTILDTNKAQEIEALDVSHLTPFFETFIICTAGSEPHSKSLADKVITRLKHNNGSEVKVEGYNTGGWICINHEFTAVHIFTAEQRDKYSLEKLWKLSVSTATDT